MIKRLFLSIFLLVPFALFSAETARVGMSMNPNAGRPSTTLARAPMVAGITGVVTGSMSGISSVVATASDSRCKNPLPDQSTATRCIQKYMACVNQDTVCGSHFENCDTATKFAQKKIFCQDTLMACPDDGINAIFGSSIKSATTIAKCDGEDTVVARNVGNAALSSVLQSLTYTATSMLKTAIDDGAAWVANNAAQSCINVVDGCIKRACQGDPYKCISVDVLDMTIDSDGDGIPDAYADVASQITLTAQTNVAAASIRVNPTMVQQYVENMTYSPEQVKGYIKNTCQTDIGTNKACYIVANGNVPKNDSWLTDDFEVANIYNTMVQARLAVNQNKILEWLAGGVGKAIDSCKTAASDCVKNACGSGSIAACYGSALQLDNSIKVESISTIAPRCSGVITANQNCQDLLIDKATAPTTATIWDQVWGTAATGYVGAFGLVGELNSQLASMFGDTFVKNTRKQCQGEAESCVRRECGSDFMNCYLNDSTASIGVTIVTPGVVTSAAAGGFDETMARNICLIPIKKSDACQTYYDIEYAKVAKNGSADSWGTGLSASNAWGSGSWTPNTQTDLANACTAATTYSTTAGGAAATAQTNLTNAQTAYNTALTAAGGNTADPTVVAAQTALDAAQDAFDLADSNATSAQDAQDRACAIVEQNVFFGLIADIGATARAELTKKQNQLKNACENHSGQSSFGDAYVWATKPAAGVGANYAANGLGATQAATPNLWGGFCQIKINLSSTDGKLMQFFQGGALQTGDNTTVTMTANTVSGYFSLGDTVMCGSWMRQTDLDALEASIRYDAGKDSEAKRDWWSSRDPTTGLTNGGILSGILGGIGGAVGGAFGGAAIGDEIGKGINKSNGAVSSDEINGAKSRISEFEPKLNSAMSSVSGISADVDSKQKIADSINDSIGQISGAIAGSKTVDALKANAASTVSSGNTAADGFMKNAISTVITGLTADDTVQTATTKISAALNTLSSQKQAEADSAAANLKFQRDTGKGTNGSDTIDGISSTGKLVLNYYKPGGNIEYKTIMSEYKDLQDKIKQIREAKSSESTTDTSKTIGAIAGGVLGGAALGIGAGLIADSATKRADDLNKLKAQDDAVKAWFDNVGSKIQCVIGGKVVGKYGDLIELR